MSEIVNEHIPEFKKYPLEVLPKPMQNYVAENADSIGCDPSFIALPLFSALASLIGNSRVLRATDSWAEPAIIWAGIIGESGTLKSPAIQSALQPIYTIQSELDQQHADELMKWKEADAAYKIQLKEWEKNLKNNTAGETECPAEPAEPTRGRTFTSDATIEALITLLRQNPKGLLVNRDELAGWVGNMDKYSGKSSGESAQWLEMFGGRPLTVDRKGSGNQSIANASVSICGGIQPGTLRRVVGTSLREQGLLARFLLTLPPRVPKKFRDHPIQQATADRLLEVACNLRKLSPKTTANQQPAPKELNFTPEAKHLFKEFVDEHGEAQYIHTDDLAAAYSKLECYCLRFAIVIHEVSVAYEQTDQPFTVESSTIQSAIDLVKWHCQETERIYTSIDGDNERDGMNDVLRLAVEKGGRLSTRDLMRKCKKLNANSAKESLEGLINSGLGEWASQDPRKPGSHSWVFQVNGYRVQ